MRTRTAGVAVSGAVLAALGVTWASGSPPKLPDIALGSTMLFHLERMVALVGSYLVLVVVVTRAWSGQLPSELSGQGIKYAAEEAKEVASDNFLELSREIELLRSRVERVEKRA